MTHRDQLQEPARRGWAATALRYEVAALAFFLVMQFGFRIPEWWFDGTRVEGTLTEVDSDSDSDRPSGRFADAVTELSYEIELWSREEVGDEVSAIVMPGDRSKAAGPGELQVYVAIWLLSCVLPVALPLYLGIVARPWRSPVRARSTTRPSSPGSRRR